MPEAPSPEHKKPRTKKSPAPPVPHPNRTPAPDDLDATLARLVNEAEGPVWTKRPGA